MWLICMGRQDKHVFRSQEHLSRRVQKHLMILFRAPSVQRKLSITILYVLCSHTCTIIGIDVLKSDYPCFASIYCCIVTKMLFSSVSSFPILSHSQEASYISSCLVLTHKSTISPPAAPPIMIGSTGVEFV